MTTSTEFNAEEFLREEFKKRGGINVLGVETRSYPEETNYIVLVAPGDINKGAQIGNELDDAFASSSVPSFVIVRKAAQKDAKSTSPATITAGVHDPRATDLARLASARSRVSLAVPSLSYVRDAQAHLSTVTAARHQLIFGRRGAGKSALLVEARTQVEAEGALTCWVNVQALRHEPFGRVLLYIFEELLSQVLSARRQVRPESIVATDLAQLFNTVRGILNGAGDLEQEERAVVALAPRIQRSIRRFLEIEGATIFVFLDDFYYISREQQPRLLDVLHGAVRDCQAWLKIASIRHLTRWYQSQPPMGLQTGHDADLVDLDVTLQDPARAQNFLENVLLQYARAVEIPVLTRVFQRNALDRLVLASGAVPRDFLVLASSAITKAQRRPNARLVGVQDVNQAAGDAAGVKVQELEDDMASNIGMANRTLATLKLVRDFCLNERAFTYFLVSYRDKEDYPDRYNLLADLMDVRLVHLLDGGVSDPHAAGQRLEAFMLDLSQYSGSRLKQKIRVLDFSAGKIVSRETRSKEAVRIGDTALQVISILRAAPILALSRLDEIISRETPSGEAVHPVSLPD